MPNFSFVSLTWHRPMLVDKAAAGVKILFAISICDWKEEQVIITDAVFTNQQGLYLILTKSWQQPKFNSQASRRITAGKILKIFQESCGMIHARIMIVGSWLLNWKNRLKIRNSCVKFLNIDGKDFGHQTLVYCFVNCLEPLVIIFSLMDFMIDF